MAILQNDEYAVYAINRHIAIDTIHLRGQRRKIRPSDSGLQICFGSVCFYNIYKSLRDC